MIPWHSSFIIERISSNVLKTSSGRTYVLIGKMAKHPNSCKRMLFKSGCITWIVFISFLQFCFDPYSISIMVFKEISLWVSKNVEGVPGSVFELSYGVSCLNSVSMLSNYKKKFSVSKSCFASSCFRSQKNQDDSVKPSKSKNQQASKNSTSKHSKIQSVVTCEYNISGLTVTFKSFCLNDLLQNQS